MTSDVKSTLVLQNCPYILVHPFCNQFRPSSQWLEKLVRGQVLWFSTFIYEWTFFRIKTLLKFVLTSFAIKPKSLVQRRAVSTITISTRHSWSISKILCCLFYLGLKSKLTRPYSDYVGRKRPFQTSRSCFFESLICRTSDQARQLICFDGDSQAPKPRFSRSSKTSQMQCGNQGEPSLFPEIDEFISSIVAEQVCPVAIDNQIFRIQTLWLEKVSIYTTQKICCNKCRLMPAIFANCVPKKPWWSLKVFDNKGLQCSRLSRDIKKVSADTLCPIWACFVLPRDTVKVAIFWNQAWLTCLRFPGKQFMLLQDGVRGWIRNWAWSEEERLLVFNIGGNRFCHNVGRHHKSNGVYYIADLQVNLILFCCALHHKTVSFMQCLEWMPSKCCRIIVLIGSWWHTSSPICVSWHCKITMLVWKKICGCRMEFGIRGVMILIVEDSDLRLCPYQTGQQLRGAPKTSITNKQILLTTKQNMIWIILNPGHWSITVNSKT